MGEFLHSIEPLLTCEPLTIVLAGRELLETEMQSRGIKMRLAHIDSLVAAVTQRTCQGVFVVPRFAILVADHALAVRSHPRHQ